MSRGTRVAGTLALCAAIGVATATAIAITERRAIAERVLLERIAARGVEPAALRVERVDARGIAIADLVAGPPGAPDLAITRIEAAWSPHGLRAGRLDALRIGGVRLRGTRSASGLSFGSLDPLLAGSESGSAAALPASSLEVDDGAIEIETPQGVARGSFGGSLQGAGDGAIAGAFALSVDGAGLRAQGDLSLSGTIDEPAFRLSLQPEAGLPIRGRIDVRGRVRREDGARAIEAAVALRDVGYTGPLASASGVAGAVALRAPPLQTPGRQVISIARLDAGVPFTDGLVDFALRPDGRLAVAAATLHLAGGELRAEDVVLDPRASSTAVTLEASGIDLADLLAHVDLPGLAGSGRVEGRVPLAISKTAITVTDGLLRASEGGGRIAYTPDERVRALAAARPNDLGLAVAAFSDFRYEVLEARLDGDLDGEMKIGLHVRGANPGFQDGRPVELNLNLDARLADLVRAGAASYRVPKVVEERLEAFSKGEQR